MQGSVFDDDHKMLNEGSTLTGDAGLAQMHEYHFPTKLNPKPSFGWKRGQILGKQQYVQW